jgi:uncharacterized delta-60 repeat protein
MYSDRFLRMFALGVAMSTQAAKALSYLMAFAAATLLMACGGGSGGGTPQPPPGTLDTGFGDAGTVITERAIAARSVALQSDGKIVVGASDGLLIRYDREGMLDATFGVGGFVSAAPDANPFDVWQVLLQPDGKIVAAGTTGHCALMRYSMDGVPDPLFGDRGLAVWNPAGAASECRGTVIDLDGAIVVGVQVGTFPTFEYVITRFRADGTPVSTFVAGDSAGYSGGIAIQPDGKILATWSLLDSSGFQCIVARFDSEGIADAEFGAHGRTVWPVDSSGCVLTLQPDGRILVSSAGSVARFLGDGTRDSGFGVGGVVAGIDASTAPSSAPVLQWDGKIVVSGALNAGDNPQFAVWRFSASGDRDDSFGTAGVADTLFLGRGAALSVAIQPNGRIVAVGYTMPPGKPIGPQEAALARYFGG